MSSTFGSGPLNAPIHLLLSHQFHPGFNCSDCHRWVDCWNLVHAKIFHTQGKKATQDVLLCPALTWGSHVWELSQPNRFVLDLLAQYSRHRTAWDNKPDLAFGSLEGGKREVYLYRKEKAARTESGSLWKGKCYILQKVSCTMGGGL